MRETARVLLGVMALATCARAQVVRVLDQDAHQAGSSIAGAVYDVDASLPSTAAPAVVAAADAGAPFELVTGIAVSPRDGRTWIADTGINAPPRIFVVDCAGALGVAYSGAPLVTPYALTFLPDGRLVVCDAGAGSGGALFALDPACSPSCALALLSDGTSNDLGAAAAFEQPLDVAYDAITNRLYVVDAYRVLAVTMSGRVSLVSDSLSFVYLVGVAVRRDGGILAADQGAVSGDSALWLVDPSDPRTQSNATLLSDGAQYSQIEDVTRDAAGDVFLVDWGDYNVFTGTFDAPPALWRLDPADPDPATNGRLVNDSTSFLTPICAAIADDCVRGPGLAINREITNVRSPLGKLPFTDMGCLVPEWSLCPEEVRLGTVDGMVLAGEGSPTGRDELRLYQDAAALPIVTVARQGSDLVLRER